MLSFFKNKPSLQDIIPNNFIDIHSHLLPGIDDGSKSMEDTFILYKKMKGIGIEQFITTPHVINHIWENSRESIEALEAKTKKKLESNFPEVKFKAAAEYMIDIDFISLFNQEKLLTLKDNHVLVEMSYVNPPIQLYDIIFEIQLAGYIPVLAHPERYLFYYSNFTEYHKLKKAGCLFQLNLLSTVGYYGENVTKIAEKLLKKGMINFVGSDIHHQNHVASFQNKINFKDISPLKEAIFNNSFFKF